MRKRLLLVWLLAMGVAHGAEDPERVFTSPPEAAKPGVWWHWMGCNVTKEGITRDLEAFKAAGIGGATLFGLADVCTPWAGHIENSPTDGLIAFTDPWWQLVRHAAGEARRLGLDLGLHGCPGYTHSGGPWVRPELSMLEVCSSATRVEGGKAWSGRLPRPSVDPRANMQFPVVNQDTGQLEKPIIEARRTFYRDIVTLALPDTGAVAKDQIVDLTRQVAADGRLDWAPPPGRWIVYRIGYTTMGSMTQPNQWEARGLECDKMSAEATEFHVRHVLDAMKRNLGDLVGTGVKHVLFDSYEAGTPSWTPRMPEEFARRRGYDLTPFMATFAGRVVGDDAATQRFRADFDRTVRDLYRDVFFATTARLLHEAGLQFACEPYGGPFDTGEVTPYLDRVLTEFWSGGGFHGGADAGFFNAGPGQRHNVLEAEAFTGAPEQSQWTEHPGGLKLTGDGAFCSGINRLVLHGAVLQPWDDRYRPGNSMGRWGTHFGRTQTWWEPGKAWIAYLQRCQALLQWGQPAPTQDCRVLAREGGVELRSLHRRDGAIDVFFVANQRPVAGRASCVFKVAGRQPEWWDPVTGARRDLTAFERIGDETRLLLALDAAQSGFVVFRRPAEPAHGRNAPERRPIAEIAGPWEVQFDPRWGGPAQVRFDKLEDWTQRPEPGIRYYSGTATYRTTFDGAAGARLDLGVVPHLARVRVNGADLGVVWCAPYSLAIPQGLLKPVGNQLEVEVTNVWANRLIGDEQEPPDCEWLPGHMPGGRYLKRFPDWFRKSEPRPSQGRYGFVTWNYFTKDSPLVPSGLLGPVRLLAEDWTGTEPPLAAPEATLLDPAGRARWAETLEEDVLKAGLAAIASVSEERVAHDGGGANADALFNGTTRNGAGDDTTTDDGKTFRGYGSGSTLTVRLTQPHDLTAVRTFAAHPDGRASQGYTLWVATAADPGRFDKVETASAACAGGASELRLRVDAKGVVALRFEFTDGPLGFNVYREIQIVGQPALAKEPK